MRKEITVDDLTGIETDEAAAIQGVFGEESFTLDLTAESRDALLSLFRERDCEPLRNLLSPTIIEAAEVKPDKPTTKPATDEPAASVVREWARANGIEVSEKGKVKQDLKDRYIAAHGK